MIDLERLFVRYIMDKLGILEGLLFVVGDEGLTITQVEEILEIIEICIKQLMIIGIILTHPKVWNLMTFSYGLI